MQLEIENASLSEVEAALNDVGIKAEAEDIQVSHGATASEIIDLAIKASEVNLSALSLFIGYAVGRGWTIGQVIGRKRRMISKLSDAIKAVDDEGDETRPKESENKEDE